LNAGNNAFKPSTSLDDKVPKRRVSSIPLDVGETGVVDRAIPNHLFRRTSLRMKAGMCVNGWTAVRLLLGWIGEGLLTAEVGRRVAPPRFALMRFR